VVDDSAVHVVVPIVVGYRSEIVRGQPAQVSLPSLPGFSPIGAVVGIDPAVPARPGSKTTAAEETFAVTVEVANPGHRLTAGSTANVRLPTVRRATVAVNSLAVLGQRAPFVFVLTGSVVRQRQIEVGISDGAFTEILSGLAVGDRVVISGGSRLVDGSAVHVTGSENS
jgi:HlyD family secretion protein